MTTTALAPQAQNLPEMFHGKQGINFNDIILPVVTIRQNQYRKEEMKKFKAGDVVLKPSLEVIGNEEKGAHFVLVGIEKAYRICDMTDGEAKTKAYESAEVEKPFQYEDQGRLYRRDRCFVAHILLRENLASQAKMFERLAKGELVDPDDFSIPSRVVFARSSLQAGKVLNTHAELSRVMNNQSPAFITFQLKSIEQSNDRGRWFSFDVSKAPKDVKYTPKELLPACEFWVQTLAKAKFKAADEDEVAEEMVSEAAPVTDDNARF